ncbi:MATE family efflux transporter [Pseudomonas sp. LH1G9]|uniref:MATE family efflux transporter n=1 Tax=Pseudomonas sp. LH1G9 TaxID=2083055 RepID=UPI000CF30424|nr:MATE family efflux transporter [Pseudomonas sp. LH1G9]
MSISNRIAHHGPLPELLPFLRAAIPLVLTNCVNAAQSMLTIFLASTISLSAAASAGYINRAYFIYGAIIISINGAGSIRLNRLNGSHQRAEFEKVLKRMVRFSILGAATCFAIFFLGSHYIAKLSNPENTVDTVPQYLRWMAVSYIAITLASPYYMALIAKKRGSYILKSVLISLIIGSTFSAISILHLKLSLSYLGAGCALAEVIYLFLIIKAYKRLSTTAPPTTTQNISDTKPEFKNSFAKDASNLFLAMIISTLVDFLILYILVEDTQFVALMSFYFSTTAMLQGISLGFATAASVSIAEAINKNKTTYITTVIGYLLYSLPLALICALACYGYLYHTFLQGNKLPTHVPYYIIVQISLITFISCITLFSQRAILRAKGDTTFIKRLAFIVSAIIKFPLVFYISQDQPASDERTSLLFSVFLLCSLIGLIAIGFRISRSFHIEGVVSPAAAPAASTNS